MISRPSMNGQRSTAARGRRRCAGWRSWGCWRTRRTTIWNSDRKCLNPLGSRGAQATFVTPIVLDILSRPTYWSHMADDKPTGTDWFDREVDLIVADRQRLN